MAYPAVSVANSIIKLAKEKGINDLTHMKIQKLMYFAQFFYLKYFGKILIDDNFVRWEYGPVIPSLYYQLRSYQSQPINDYIQQLIENNEVVVYMIPDADEICWEYLDEVVDEFGKRTAYELSEITHTKGSSWDHAKKNEVITLDNMKNSII